MKLIEQNPFRILGIPVNASAKDLAANKGKMRLLDIGKEVSFPLDLSELLSPINRTKETVAVAEHDINQPQDKVLHAMFWIAMPDSPIGKLAYEHLLQGMLDSAVEKFCRCPKWEARLSFATLLLQQGDFAKALNVMSAVFDKHGDEFVSAVAGQTYTEESTSLHHRYIEALSTEIDASELYAQLQSSDIPTQMLDELRGFAVNGPIATIEKEIAASKSVSADDAQAQLEAGKRLSNNTHKARIQLQKLIGENDPRYSRLVDKLAKQILQCSINYFNNVDGENREIIENALKLGEYAIRIAVGKMARDHILHNVEILRKKKENLPPAEVEDEINAILKALKDFGKQSNNIENSVKLLNTTKPYLQSIKGKLGSANKPYISLSTHIVADALNNVIENVNESQRTDSLYNLMYNVKKQTRIEDIKNTVEAAWGCIQIMDAFDMEQDFRIRYNTQRDILKKMCSRLGINTLYITWKNFLITEALWFLVIFVVTTIVCDDSYYMDYSEVLLPITACVLITNLIAWIPGYRTIKNEEFHTEDGFLFILFITPIIISNLFTWGVIWLCNIIYKAYKEKN